MLTSLLMAIAILMGVSAANPAMPQGCRGTRLGSSAISAAEWCGLPGGSGTLLITFTNGRTYSYSGVPLSTYQSLVSASSAGAFFNSNIRGRFPNHELR
jgi:hypothetical protein